MAAVEHPAPSDFSDSPNPASAASSCAEPEMAPFPFFEPLARASGRFEVRVFHRDTLEVLGLRKETLVRRRVILARHINDKRNKQGVMMIKRFRLRKLSDCRVAYKTALILREMGIVRQLQHPNIIPTLYAVECPRYMALITDFCLLGTLTQNLESLTPYQVESFAEQLGDAMSYLRYENMVHRNVQTDNVLVKSSRHVQLCDFSFASHVPADGKVKGVVGTAPCFMAPEVRSFDEHETAYDAFLADSFSCGVVLWSLLTQTRPPPDAHFEESIRDMTTGKLESLLQGYVLELLEKDPKDRFDVINVAKSILIERYRTVMLFGVVPPSLNVIMREGIVDLSDMYSPKDKSQ